MEEKEGHYYGIYEQTGQGILDKITNTITEKISCCRKYRYYRTFQCDVHEQFHTLSQGKGTLRVCQPTGHPENQMQLAEKYLLEGKYSISEIAFKVGINSNVYFRQCFKKEFGMSASDYLKQLTGKSIDEKSR